MIGSYQPTSLQPKGHDLSWVNLSTTSRQLRVNGPSTVALALQQQLLDAGQVPITDSDWKVDMIITSNDTVTKPNDL